MILALQAPKAGLEEQTCTQSINTREFLPDRISAWGPELKGATPPTNTMPGLPWPSNSGESDHQSTLSTLPQVCGGTGSGNPGSSGNTGLGV